MVTRVILRLLQKKVVLDKERKIGLQGLFGEETWKIKEYNIKINSFIIQYPDSPDAYKYSNMKIEIAPPPWKQYCRWHNAPLWERDDPSKRLYCVTESQNYCKQHKRSLRALYELCLSTNSTRLLGVCKKIDEYGKTEYALYLTDAGAGRVKVGVTRLFRVLERLSEQPHNIATILHVTDSLYEARKLEMEIGKSGLASQVKARKPRIVPINEAASRLSYIAEKISKKFGLEWKGELIRVTSPYQRLIISSKPYSPERVYGLNLTVKGYWGGYIIAESSGQLFIVRDKELIHKNSIIINNNL